MRVLFIARFVVIACLFSASRASSQPATGKPAEGGVVVRETDVRAESPGEWVDSDNGDLSLRLRVKSASVASKDSMVVMASIRNNRLVPVTILRPFGDACFARSVQIKIWGERGRIKYSGAKEDYDLTAKAFVTLAANETVTDTLELTVGHYAGTAKGGRYALRYDYAYSGNWDKTVAGKGIKGIWRGAMCSREIQIAKQDATKQP